MEKELLMLRKEFCCKNRDKSIHGISFKHILIIICCFLFMTISIPQKSWAFLDFIHRISQNAAQTSRGNTVCAIGEQPTDTTFNPALGSFITQNMNGMDDSLETYFMFATTDFEFRYDGTNGDRYNTRGTDNFAALPELAYLHHIKDSPMTWGLNFYIPDGFMVDYSYNTKYFGGMNTHTQIVHYRFGPFLSYEITPNLSVGARIAADYANINLRLPFGMAFFNTGEMYGYGWSTTIGLAYKLNEKLQCGLYYDDTYMQGSAKSKNRDGDVKMCTTPVSGGVGSPYADFNNIDMQVQNLDFPRNFGFGVAYMPTPSWRFTADIKYLMWDEDFDKLTLKIHSKDFAAANPKGTNKIFLPLGIDNQMPVSVGVEYFFGDIYRLGVGYHYHDVAMDNDQFIPSVPTTSTHFISTGLTIKPAETVKIDFAVGLGFMDDGKIKSSSYDRSIEKQLGLPAGSLDSEYNNSTQDFQQYNFEIGFTCYW